MLAIRMRRTGRKGHAQFRVIVQDSRFSPSSGRVVAYLGSYDPHAKTATLDKEKIGAYLNNGAQPSDRAAQLFKTEGITLPTWVKKTIPKSRSIRHPEKLRRNRPAEEAKPEAVDSDENQEPVTSENVEEAPADESGQAEAPDLPVEPEEAPAESPAEETAPAEDITESTEETPAPTSDEKPQ